MFELAIALAIVILILVFSSYWFTLGAFVVMMILIGSGLYSMFAGAPFVGSSKKRMETMFEFAKLKKNDRVADLGCGDGRVVYAVADKGVKYSVGYEFSLPTYFYALWKKKKEKRKGEIKFKNFWKEDFSKFDVLICFLLGKTMDRFARDVWPKLKKGTRVISNEFIIEALEPDRAKNRVYLYIKK